MSRLRITLSLTLLMALSAIGVSAQSLRKAPELNLKDLRERRIKLSDYQGKVVLLNFWATWCVPCRTEIPALVKLQEQYRNQGLRIIGITYPPQTASQVRRFLTRKRVNYRIGLGAKSTKALFDESEVLPVTVVIDQRGRVREVIKGILFGDEFDEKIKPLLLSP